MRYRSACYLQLALALSLSILISTHASAQGSLPQGAPTQAPTTPGPTAEKSTTQAPNTLGPAPEKTTQQVPTPPKPVLPYAAPDPWFIYAVIFVVLLGTLLSILSIRAALLASTWNLTDALSEEAQVTPREKDGKPLLDTSQKPIVISEMRASSSRVIAFMGMIVILWMFLGFGTFAMYAFAKSGDLPDSIDKVVNFLLAGLTLFAPYAVNKVSKMFESLSPKPS